MIGLRTSLLAGIITVALLELPDHGPGHGRGDPACAPFALSDASASLGATKLETAFHVIVRQCLPGIITGVLIAFGRGIGDAASVLFTAGFSDRIPGNLFQPAATLPLAIFFQLGTALSRSPGKGLCFGRHLDDHHSRDQPALAMVRPQIQKEFHSTRTTMNFPIAYLHPEPERVLSAGKRFLRTSPSISPTARSRPSSDPPVAAKRPCSRRSTACSTAWME